MQEYTNKVQISQVETPSISGQVSSDEIFSINEGRNRAIGLANAQTVVSYEMNLDRKVVKRIIYTYLDWLGDVGGLNGALGGSFLVILAVL